MKAGKILPQEYRGTMIRHRLRRAAGLVLCLFSLLTGPLDAAGAATESSHLAGLKKIHAEVKEMGPYPGDDFVRREFFVGEDDDDTNKDIQVVVLIQSFEMKDKMTIRVTQMARERAGSRISLAQETRDLVCLVAGEQVEIQSSGYEKEALDSLVSDILTAVRNKKRLLKLEKLNQSFRKWAPRLTELARAA